MREGGVRERESTLEKSPSGPLEDGRKWARGGGEGRWMGRQGRKIWDGVWRPQATSGEGVVG